MHLTNYVAFYSHIIEHNEIIGNIDNNMLTNISVVQLLCGLNILS